jgi:hypothetical protein
MKIIKEESIVQKEHFFDLDCTITIEFRSSSHEKIISRFTRIEDLTLRFVSEE